MKVQWFKVHLNTN